MSEAEQFGSDWSRIFSARETGNLIRKNARTFIQQAREKPIPGPATHSHILKKGSIGGYLRKISEFRVGGGSRRLFFCFFHTPLPPYDITHITYILHHRSSYVHMYICMYVFITKYHFIIYILFRCGALSPSSELRKKTPPVSLLEQPGVTFLLTTFIGSALLPH